MLLNNKLCVDTGSVNCPCSLAEYGKCIVCSRLGGCRETPGACGCRWHGVCIYNEYLQNNGCVNEQREARLCEIQKIKWYEEDLAVMRIAVPRGIAEKAALPGSFVFVRADGAEKVFEFPVSVMQSDYEASEIELAVKASGPKSKALLEFAGGGNSDESLLDDAFNASQENCINKCIEIRGIYRNGLIGSEKLMKTGKKVLCIAKGAGLAPVVNYMRWADGRDEIDLIADLEKINKKFADECLSGCIINSLKYDHLPSDLSWAEEEKYDVIVISASDYYQKNIYVPEVKKVQSNNHIMCCGEGICGACIHVDAAGTVHRMCKECKCSE